MKDNKLHDNVKNASEILKEKTSKINEKAQRTTKKITRFFCKIGIVTILIISVVAAVKIAYLKGLNKQDDVIDITVVELDEKLTAIGELSTFTYEYTNEIRVDNPREIWGVVIPLTTHEVDLFYSGVIKVGYEIEDIECEIDRAKRIIYVKIPEVQVFDNYIKLDDLVCKERNNILNPIETETVIGYFENIKGKELKNAEEDGIYEHAEEQLKTIIAALFESLPDYEVIFVD